MPNIASRLGQIFWGLVLVAADIRVRTFDILPDFVGYILVAVGLGGLLSASRHFGLARLLSWILVPVSAGAVLFHGNFGMILRLAQVPLDGAMIWFLCGGLIEMAQSRQRADLVSRAALCRVAYVALLGVIAAIGLTARILPSVASALSALTLLAVLCVVVVLLHLLYEVKRMTTTEAPVSPAQA